VTIKDLGPALQLRYILVDANEKVVAVFADYNKAKAYEMQFNRAVRKL